MKKGIAVVVTVAITFILHGSLNSGNGVSAQVQSHYCSRDPVERITGEVEGDIYTRYEGDSHYRNNQNCVWIIDAGSNNRVEITVVSSDLQWAPESAICPGYDHVAIKDGENGEEESIILQWCGHTTPHGAVSSGRYVRIEFMSDKNNPYNYAGVQLHFRTFPFTECAPSWDDSTAGFCYKLMDKEMDWSSAQRECNTGGANLVSVSSQSEHDFLLNTYGSSTKEAWIGLNDIAKLGDYQWIDLSEVTYNRFENSHEANQYQRCVVLQFKERNWETEDCEKYSSKPLCKSNRGSKTTLFPIPQETPDEGDSGIPIGRIVIIIIAVSIFVILVVVGCCIYWKMKARRRKSRYTKEAKAGESPDTNDGTTALQSRHREAEREAPQPSAPAPEEHVMVIRDPQMVAPPGYDEAMSHPIVGPPHRADQEKVAY